MAASNDPTTLITAPKRLASSTSTTANRNGATSFHWVLEKIMATATAHTALTAIPSVDCRVESNFVFMCLMRGTIEFTTTHKIARIES